MPHYTDPDDLLLPAPTPKNPISDLSRQRGTGTSHALSFFDPSRIGEALEVCGYTVEEHVARLVQMAQHSDSEKIQLAAMKQLQGIMKDSAEVALKASPDLSERVFDPFHNARGYPKTVRAADYERLIETVEGPITNPLSKETEDGTNRDSENGGEHRVATPELSRLGSSGGGRTPAQERCGNVKDGFTKQVNAEKDAARKGSFHLPPAGAEPGSSGDPYGRARRYHQGITGGGPAEGIDFDGEIENLGGGDAG